MSLFDYLGHAAGSELGKQVAEYAKIRNAKHSTRYVSNPSYSGEVMLYEKEFLDEYFGVKKLFEDSDDFTEINTQLMKDSYDIQEKENEERIF
jgi:hypothetical protein